MKKTDVEHLLRRVERVREAYETYGGADKLILDLSQALKRSDERCSALEQTVEELRETILEWQRGEHDT